MKILVDTQTDEIQGRYEEPLDFSISGRYVVDVPDGFGTDPDTNVLADAIQEKIGAFKGYHLTLTNYFNDEFLAVPNIDPAITTSTLRYLTGPNKRAAILPGGSIITNILSIGAAFTTTFFHLHGFILHSEPGSSSASHPSPSRLLYNYDGSAFITFDPSDFLIEYYDSVGTGVLYTPVTPDVEDTGWSSGGAIDFRIKLTNNHVSRVYYLSDWLFLYD
jgi:hypothetical protein